MVVRVLDPTHELKAAGVQPAARLSSLQGKTVGFISNGKEGTKGYFAQLERILREDLRVADVVWRAKSNYSAPADAHIIDEGGNGTPSSPASAIEGVVHRAVCTTRSQLSGKGCRPWP